MLTNDKLFNCCTGHKEPDWSLYSYLFIGFNKIDKGDDDDDGGYVVNAYSFSETQFVSIYGRFKDSGEAEPITDIEDCELVRMILAELLKRSGLPLQ